MKDLYVPLANLIATLVLLVVQRVLALHVAKATEKIEVVHKLVNSAAEIQQRKVDALEQELRVVRGLLDDLSGVK